MLMFLKKNILFFIVFTVVLLLSVSLLVMDVSLYGDIEGRKAEIDTTTENYNKERNAKIAPVSQNADKIVEDTAELKGQVIKLQRRFGAPYRKFLLIFAREIGLEENVLFDEFRKHFAEYKIKQGEKEESLGEVLGRPPFYIKKEQNALFFDFMDKYRERLARILTLRAAEKAAAKAGKPLEDAQNVKAAPADREKVEKAYNAFFENIMKDPLFTVEDLAPRDPAVRRRLWEDIFASALGLPRTQEPLVCQTYLEKMQNEFVAKRLIPGVTDIDTLRRFTYSQYVNDAPVVQDIPEIFLAMPVYEDIARRLRSVENLEVVDLVKNGPSPAPASDKYLFYNFRLKVNCTMKSIREFVNKLHEAYKDDRVYVVRWIAVKAGSDEELAELRKILEDRDQGGQDSRPQPARGGRGRSRASARRSTPSGIAPYLESLDPKYATAIVGKNTAVTAEIDFDYYIYVGERVHNYQVNRQ